MPRLTRSVFRDLFVWMVGYGLLMGIVFPPFVVVLGVSADQAMTPVFFGATLSAGLLVGLMNWGLTRLIVGARMRLLASSMHFVADSVKGATYSGDWSACNPDTCRIAVDSSDELGDAAGAFNALVGTLAQSHGVETAVRQFTDTLATHLDIDELADAALGQLMQVAGASAGALMVDQDGQLVLRAQVGITGADTLVDVEPVRRAFRTGHVVRPEIPAGVQVQSVLTSFRPHDILLLPVGFRAGGVAVVVLATGATFAPEVEKVLVLLAQGLGVALNNALTHERLQQMAAIDPLTGCYNRRLGARRLDEEYARAIRAGGQLGILVVDVDGFKATNDIYGHLTGDRVLTGVATAIRRVLRESDDLVRFGGDEFLALLPGASPDDVRAAGERVCASIGGQPLDVSDHRVIQSISVTVSAGGASYPTNPADQAEDLFRQADIALLAAKAAGRSQMLMATAETGPTATSPAFGSGQLRAGRQPAGRAG